MPTKRPRRADVAVPAVGALPASTATRAVTAGGNTAVAIRLGLLSNNSHDGMLTTRAGMPCGGKLLVGRHAQAALRCRCRSESLAAEPLAASASTYAPFAKPLAGAYFVRSSVGRFCRVSTKATGRSLMRISVRHASAASLASPGRMITARESPAAAARCSIGCASGRLRPGRSNRA